MLRLNFEGLGELRCFDRVLGRKCGLVIRVQLSQEP